MTDQYKRVLRACYDGALRMTASPYEPEVELFCYTQDTFWSKDGWNDITRTHRGALYHNGKQVNQPFEKIFNLDEVPETAVDLIEDRMANEPYRIMHKANGHLFIVSSFIDDTGNQRVVFHTKGGLLGPDNTLLQNDIRIFYELYEETMNMVLNTFPTSTWMFEAIVAHDKHTMYDTEVETFGSDNCFVLLGAASKEELDRWSDFPYDDLEDMANLIGCPVIHTFSDLDGSPVDWLDHTSTEGYVIQFLSDNHRVKIKTREYWGIRFKKDLTPERILAMFRKSGDSKFITKLPEEVAEQIIFVLDALYGSWWYNHYTDIPSIQHEIDKVIDNPLTTEERTHLFALDQYTIQQKRAIALYSDGKDPTRRIWNSKDLRNQFYTWMFDDKKRLEPFADELKQIVDDMGKRSEQELD